MNKLDEIDIVSIKNFEDFNPEKLMEFEERAHKNIKDYISKGNKNIDGLMTLVMNKYSDYPYPIYYSPEVLYMNDDYEVAKYRYSDKLGMYVVIGDVFNMFDENIRLDILEYLKHSISRLEGTSYCETADSDIAYAFSPDMEKSDLTSEDDYDFIVTDDYRIYCHLVAAYYRGAVDYSLRLDIIRMLCGRMGIELDNKFYKKVIKKIEELCTLIDLNNMIETEGTSND